MTSSKNNIDSILSLLRKMAQVHLERGARDNNSIRQKEQETVRLGEEGEGGEGKGRRGRGLVQLVLFV